MDEAWYGVQLPFTDHFSRFVGFINTSRKDQLKNVKFPERELFSIETFSRVLVDGGKSNKAIGVLSFALGHSRTRPISHDTGKGVDR